VLIASRKVLNAYSVAQLHRAWVGIVVGISVVEARWATSPTWHREMALTCSLTLFSASISSGGTKSSVLSWRCKSMQEMNGGIEW